MYFFAIKAFARLLRNFLEICRRGGCSIIRFVDSLLFLVLKMLRASFQRRKAAAFSNK